MKTNKSFSESINEKLPLLSAINVHTWYTLAYPSDDLGWNVRSVNLSTVALALGTSIDVYTVLGVGDSIIRERVFGLLAEVLGVDYDTVYNEWLKD